MFLAIPDPFMPLHLPMKELYLKENSMVLGPALSADQILWLFIIQYDLSSGYVVMELKQRVLKYTFAF